MRATGRPTSAAVRRVARSLFLGCMRAAIMAWLLSGAASWALAGWLLLGAASSARAAPLPRIVSINPCVDAVLVRLAQPEQILAISHYSHDPRATSLPLDVARRFRITSGTAEEVVALAPDVVMSGPHVSPATIFALERMRIRIAKFSVPESIAENKEQIRQIAALAAAPQRGEALIGAIAHAIRLAQPRDERRISAVIWQGGGMVPGQGTLADQLLGLTGYRNSSAAYGLAKWDVLPLEYLIAAPPELVLSVGTAADDRDRMLGHPAVRELARRVAFRSYPFRLLQCGGPTIIEAVGRLAEVRKEMEQRR
jgi:iron complex transport system substrate-binding protein